MRIALVSTQRTSVPPRKTGSVELLVSLMAREMRRRGHKVTVFATADSTVDADVVSTLPHGYHEDESVWDWELAEFMQLGRVYERARDFDVINSHVYCWALPFCRLTSTPTVHTFHICPTPDFLRYGRSYPEQMFIALTAFQAGLFGDVPISAVIPNGIDTRWFEFSSRPGAYLAYLGDIRPDKAPLECIRVARAADVPLRIAGPRTRYFTEVVAPHVDGDFIRYVGEVDHSQKNSLLKDALAFVFPVTAPEACPLVILEAMACGTPILALKHGPVPDLVDTGQSGVYVETFDEMVPQIDVLRRLDRERVRAIAVEKFDVARMVDEYLQVFHAAVMRAGH